LKTGETVLKVATSPVRHGVAGTSHFVGDLQVGRLIDGREPQNQATTEDQRLWRGMGPRQGLEPLTTIGVQNNRWSIGVRHRGIRAQEWRPVSDLPA
jgi:hypothetical protein